MGGIAGILNLDGRPIETSLLESITNRSAIRSTDGIGYWQEGNVGLGRLAQGLSPSAQPGSQPCVHPSGRYAITLHGRVDNRSELMSLLDITPDRAEIFDDAKLILECYIRWGKGAPYRILGDFAFAIWDKPNQLLFCARDILGFKPFHYSFDHKQFVFGSDLRQVVAFPGVNLAPNEAMVAEYLASNITSRSETLLTGVNRLPPAHHLTVSPKGLNLERYWDIDPENILSYSSDDEYVDHFLSIFQESVAARLKVKNNVGILLSGGMDSSCVTAMANQLLGGQQKAPAFYSASLLFEGLSCDETPQINQAINAWKTIPITRQFEAPPSGYFRNLVDEWQDFPAYPNLTAYHALRSEAFDKGVGVLLSGSGADDWLDTWDVGYQDMLGSLALGAMRHHYVSKARQKGLKQATRVAFKQCMQVLLPPQVINFYKWGRRSSHRSVPIWLNEEFAKNTGLEERTSSKTTGPFRNQSQRALYGWLQNGYGSHFIEAEERTATQGGIESRMPFHDRRIIEFGFSIPPDYKWYRSDRKPVVRHALRKTQAGNQLQFSWAEGSAMYLAALESLGGISFFKHLRIADYGFVDPIKVNWMYNRMRFLHAKGDIRYANHARPLWMIAGIELWYKRFGKSP